MYLVSSKFTNDSVSRLCKWQADRTQVEAMRKMRREVQINPVSPSKPSHVYTPGANGGGKEPSAIT